MALTESRSPLTARLAIAGTVGRLKRMLTGAGDHSLAPRAAGTAFAIRIASAAVVYLSQVVLARWMGDLQFGIYIYVWTWVLLLGEIIHLGLPLAAQRLIPKYAATGSHDHVRGFIFGARTLAFGSATAAALVGAALVRWFEQDIDPNQVVPLYLACLALPFFTLSVTLDGTARAYNWTNIALAPHFLWRPLLILVLVAAAYWAGLAPDAVTAMGAVVIGTWSMALLQLVLFDRRLAGVVARGPRRYDVKGWLAISLPIILVWGFYTLLTYTDVLVLEQFRSPNEVALYYAAARTLLLITFVSFSVAATVTPRFAAYHLAGDRAGLAAFVTSTVRWTFWPSLIATLIILAFGRPILSLFGPSFVASYPLMFILAIGLLARASVGPAERLLNMLGEQRICAFVYAGAFTVNLVGCIVLAPRLGVTGAAIAISAAIIFESTALAWVAWRRLGLNVFIWGGARAERINA